MKKEFGIGAEFEDGADKIHEDDPIGLVDDGLDDIDDGVELGETAPEPEE